MINDFMPTENSVDCGLGAALYFLHREEIGNETAFILEKMIQNCNGNSLCHALSSSLARLFAPLFFMVFLFFLVLR